MTDYVAVQMLSKKPYRWGIEIDGEWTGDYFEVDGMFKFLAENMQPGDTFNWEME